MDKKLHLTHRFRLYLTKDLAMQHPLLNNHTKAVVDRFTARKPHALLLTGEQGTGLMTIAKYIESQLRINNTQLVSLTLQPNEKSTITIDQVRELRLTTKHKNSSGSHISILVIVSTIDDMQTEAQNALLKMLEEPPVGLMFVVLCHDESTMLPTISSRCVKISVLPVSIDEANLYFGSKNTNLAKNYAISSGLPGLLTQLMDSGEHALIGDINNAKQILSYSPYQRLLQVDGSYKTAEAAKRLVTALDKICRAALKSGSQNDAWINNSLLVLSAQKKLSARVQAKLVIDELFLNLR